MNKTYTKEQITEAIAYWTGMLKDLEESQHFDKSQKITYEIENGAEIIGRLSRSDVVKLTALRYGLCRKEQQRWSKFGIPLDPSEVRTTESLTEYFSNCVIVGIARADGTPVAYTTCTQDHYQDIVPNNLYFDEGALSPTYIGTGIESELGLKTIDKCKKLGYSTFITSVDVNNPENTKNVQDIGFVPWQMNYVYNK